MSDHKPVQGTRDAVETAIDLSKVSKSASWDELISGRYRQRSMDEKRQPERRRGRAQPKQPSAPACKS